MREGKAYPTPFQLSMDEWLQDPAWDPVQRSCCYTYNSRNPVRGVANALTTFRPTKTFKK